MTEPRVGRAAYLLGLAGLLPQVAAVGLIVLGRNDPTDRAVYRVLEGYWLAMGYAGLILSFIGGAWWSFAMRRTKGQPSAAAIAVLPSIVALACLAMASPTMLTASTVAAIFLGGTIMLTPLVDRHFVQTGEAPVGWMRLRIPLSLGLGLLTVTAGVLVHN